MNKLDSIINRTGGPTDSIVENLEMSVHTDYEEEIQHAASMHMMRLRRHYMVRSSSTPAITSVLSIRVRHGLRVMNICRGVRVMHIELIETIRRIRSTNLGIIISSPNVCNLPNEITNIVLEFAP